uniref:Integrin alpha N-terminal domain-containing protein n=1 Tax=Hirondellea gigas TaxID=1518452 RepID=A0A6A7GAX9_9CRUS
MISECVVIVLCLSISTRATLVAEDDIALNSEQTLPARILCFGDFNGDRFTDVFAISSDKKSLEVYTWKQDGTALFKVAGTNGKFKKVEDATVETDLEILRATAADFDYDGRLDILIYGRNEQTSSNEVRVYFQTKDKTFNDKFACIKNVDDEPTVVDFDGDLHPDVLYGNGSVIEVKTISSKGECGFKTIDSSVLLGPLTVPNSNAFVDLNGDCRPELFLTRKGEGTNSKKTFLDIYEGKNDANGFNRKPSKTFEIDFEIGFITFMDFDGDGSTDLLIPQLGNDGSDALIHIFLNKQEKPRRDKLCERSSEWLGFSTQIMAKSPNHITFGNLDKKISSNRTYVRAGDINRDGLADLLVPVEDSNGAVSVELWIMKEHAKGVRRPRGDLDRLKDRSNVMIATFFDVRDDGILDIMVISSNDDESSFFVNSYEQDAFFVKMIGLNGLDRSSPKPYGVNQVGVTTRFLLEDLDGSSNLRSCSQLSQNGNFALQTPYCMTGLGIQKSNNYIRSFFMGFHVVQANHKHHYRRWSGVVPNSQLFMFPSESEQPDHWTLELWMDRSRSLIWVGIGVLSTLAVLIVTIYFLHRREVDEDKAEKASTAVFVF